MRNKTLFSIFIIAAFMCLNLNAFEENQNTKSNEKVDCSDPKNRPRIIAGIFLKKKKGGGVRC